MYNLDEFLSDAESKLDGASIHEFAEIYILRGHLSEAESLVKRLNKKDARFVWTHRQVYSGIGSFVELREAGF